jgi:hypothetical protein
VDDHFLFLIFDILWSATPNTVFLRRNPAHIMGKKRPHEEMAPQAAIALPQPRTFQADNTITLLVGPDEQAMVVHGDCLSRDSEFFRAALEKEWREGQSRIIRMPEETPLDIGYYIEHLYGIELPTHKLTVDVLTGDLIQAPCRLLATLYTFGERMLDWRFCDKIIRELFRLIHRGRSACWPGAEVVNIIYQGKTAGSPARRMMVDFAVNEGNPTWFSSPTALDPTYLLDLNKVLLEKHELYKTYFPGGGGGMTKEGDYLHHR